jgi:hypothetical protein
MKPHVHWLKRIAMLLVVILLLAGCATLASNERITSYDEAYDAIQRAKWVEMTAYTLVPQSAIVRLLEAKARNHAYVKLALTGDGFDYALQQNQQVANLLHPAGVHVILTSYPLHMKLLFTPSATFVTDTNFTRRGLYIRLNREERAAAAKALLGQDAYAGGFTTTKGRSLSVEAAMLNEGFGPLSVETESFGAHNPVYDALEHALASHRGVLLVVNSNDARHNESEHAAISRLESLGARVVYSTASEKIASNGSHCWVGSSNSSPQLFDQVDFGLRIDDYNTCRVLLSRLQYNAR